MSAFIKRGDKGTGRVGAESFIDHFTGKLTSVGKPLRGCSRLHGLVPDRGNPSGAVKTAEYCVFIIDPAVQKTDQHALPFQLQGGIVLDGEYTGLVQRLHAQRGKAFWNGIVGKF